MLCQICNKKEASLHYTKIINGEIEELHLCEDCSRANNEFDFDKSFSFHKLLTGIIDGLGDKLEEEGGEDFYCQKCNMTYADFKQSGKLGCDECYGSFKDKLLPLIKSIQTSQKHIGKYPKTLASSMEKEKLIDILREQLDREVLEERFEEAAHTRDKIKELEGEADA